MDEDTESDEPLNENLSSSRKRQIETLRQLKRQRIQDQINEGVVIEQSEEDKAFNKMVEKEINKKYADLNLKNKLQIVRRMQQIGVEFRRALKSPRYI